MRKEIKNIAVIGSGNVASHLCKALHEAGIAISQLYSRNLASAQALSATLPNCNPVQSIGDISDVDLVLICVNDSEIQNVLQSLDKHNLRSAYTSGSVPLDALQSVHDLGVFYPLQTFTKGKVMTYSTLPFLIEARENDLAQDLFDLAWTVSNQVHFMSSAQRQKIHIAAVFANNFTNHLIYLSEQYLKEHDLTPELLQPLINETISKANTIGAFDAQTGPARRMDQAVIDTHLAQLNPDLKKIYSELTESIKKTYKHD